jgi:hypothetical protein
LPQGDYFDTTTNKNSNQKDFKLVYDWMGALRNLDKMLELYELLQDIETKMEDKAGQQGSNIMEVDKCLFIVGNKLYVIN